MVIVPSYVSDAIDREIDRFNDENNLNLSIEDRENMYDDLLLAYDEYGEIATLTVNTKEN